MSGGVSLDVIAPGVFRTRLAPKLDARPRITRAEFQAAVEGRPLTEDEAGRVVRAYFGLAPAEWGKL